MDIDRYWLLMRPISLVVDLGILGLCAFLAFRRRLTVAGILIGISMMCFVYYDAIWQLMELQRLGLIRLWHKGSGRPFLILHQIVFPVGLLLYLLGTVNLLLNSAKHKNMSITVEPAFTPHSFHARLSFGSLLKICVVLGVGQAVFGMALYATIKWGTW
jgi:hypothetical protein